MSTRSGIGIREDDGSISAIYCHFDGYLDHVGRILYEHYSSPERARQLINLGGLSSIGPKIHEGPLHGRPSNEYCYPYISQGEELRIDKLYSIYGFLQEYRYCDFHYLYDNGDWYIILDVNKRKALYEYFKMEEETI